MTSVGWLADDASYLGGAELTQAEFRAAAPDGVEIVGCPAGAVVPGLDVYVCHNNVTYMIEDMQRIDGPCVRYWHDVGPHLQPGVREWIGQHATQVCCSPIQAEYMGLDNVALVPPPVDLSRFEAAAAAQNGSRSGAVCVASWRNYGKGPHRAAEWAAVNGGIDFFGGGQLAPPGSLEVSQERMPELLAGYERFVFLPTVIEPFGRLVAEAWASGCSLVVNDLVGAAHWIREDPDAIGTAAADFWRLVMAVRCDG